MRLVSAIGAGLGVVIVREVDRLTRNLTAGIGSRSVRAEGYLAVTDASDLNSRGRGLIPVALVEVPSRRRNAGLERARFSADAVLGFEDAAIAAVTAMELLVGVDRADETHRHARAIGVEAILSSLPVEPHNVGVARVHARLAVEAMAKGQGPPMT